MARPVIPGGALTHGATITLLEIVMTVHSLWTNSANGLISTAPCLYCFPHRGTDQQFTLYFGNNYYLHFVNVAKPQDL